MKKRKIVLLILAVIFALSAGMLVYEMLQYRRGEEIYTEAEQLVEIPDFEETVEPDGSAAASSDEAVPYVDPYAEQLRKMDFSALQEVNPEVLGWILIPGTVVSYPLLQTGNNSYYLNHTWKTWTSIVGSIFLEHQSSSDFSDFNTVIYGHNMNNGSMFGTLKKYKTQSYWKAHPTVYITDSAGSRAYQVFAAYEVSTAGTTYQIGFSSEKSRQSFLDFCMAQSVIDTGVVPTVNDHIITLSTCTGRGHATRWVVQAVLKSTAVSDHQAETAQPDTTAETPAQEGATSTLPDTAAPDDATASSNLPAAPEGQTSSGEETAPQTGDEGQSGA